MDEKTRRKIEMGKRALKFCRAHPDSNPEYNAAVARLEALLARARELELKEEKERSRRRTPGTPGREVKVIPFRRRPTSDLPDPAA
ncbi:MAG TPA: hypothetical protein VD930_11605 [Gemmatimonadales bacterium]|nr:hypothetical protein [Gemmatimonadales bacterium]